MKKTLFAVITMIGSVQAASQLWSGIPRASEIEITSAITTNDNDKLQSAIVRAFNPVGDLPTTFEQQRAILAYALAEYKKNTTAWARGAEFKRFLRPVYNAILQGAPGSREQLLNSKDSPLEFKLLWESVQTINQRRMDAAREKNMLSTFMAKQYKDKPISSADFEIDNDYNANKVILLRELEVMGSDSH